MNKRTQMAQNFVQKLKKIGAYLKILFVPCDDNNYRPKILEGKYLVYVLLLACFFRLSTFLFFWQLPNTNFFADISKMVLIDSLNKERNDLKLLALKENSLLNKAALLKANDMMQKGYFSHTSPQGITPWYWFSKVGYDYKSAGENLGIGFVDSNELHQAWNDSPSHKANLLNNNYKDVGIAFVEGNFNGAPTTIVVQHFGTQKAYSTVKPESITTPNQGTANLAPNLATTASNVAGEASYLIISPTSGLAFLTTTTANLETKSGVWTGVIKFFIKDYNSLTQKIVLIFLVINIIALILNIVIKIFVQHYDLILKATLISIALILLIAIGPKEIMALLQPYAKIF